MTHAPNRGRTTQARDLSYNFAAEITTVAALNALLQRVAEAGIEQVHKEELRTVFWRAHGDDDSHNVSNSCNLLATLPDAQAASHGYMAFLAFTANECVGAAATTFCFAAGLKSMLDLAHRVVALATKDAEDAKTVDSEASVEDFLPEAAIDVVSLATKVRKSLSRAKADRGARQAQHNGVFERRGVLFDILKTATSPPARAVLVMLLLHAAVRIRVLAAALEVAGLPHLANAVISDASSTPLFLPPVDSTDALLEGLESFEWYLTCSDHTHTVSSQSPASHR